MVVANRRGFRRAVPRRIMTWEGGSFSFATLTNATQVFTVISEAILEAAEEPTIVRVRGRLVWDLQATGAVPAQGLLTFGLIVLPTSAIGVPPGPNSDLSSDWLWWDAALGQISGGTLTAPVPDGSQGLSGIIDIDSKAMRVTKRDQTLVLVIQAANLVSTSTFKVVGSMRILLKHH